MRSPDADTCLIEPFIEHQGELRGFWLRKPRAIGDTLLIVRAGTTAPEPRAHRTTLLLDPKSAFGTGGHGTTEGCLVALEKNIRGGETVLDVGTGTGILAIAARMLGAGPVTAVDIDRSACAEARKNIALNGKEREIAVIEGGVESAAGPFDIVVANLRTPLLVALTDALMARLAEPGVAILSGILERELPSFLSFLAAYRPATPEMERKHGWITLVLKKCGGRPPIPSQAGCRTPVF